ncbi:MAG: alpha/beta hydrolase [Ilumatobacteraceae bacterium]
MSDQGNGATSITDITGTTGITDERVNVNGVDLALRRAGRDGPLALCLHGFPDTAHTWRHLLPRLADAGYRAVAPFMRGYAPSGVAADGRYQTGVLSLDANALHEALDGDDRAVLVGHDWGAIAAYGAASSAPGRWRSVVAMAVPPGGAMGAAFLGNLDQLKRSWYMFFFQHGLADMVVPADDLAFIDMIWRDWSPGHDATADLAHVKVALREPEHMAAALGYYRATLGDGYRDPELDEIQDATQQVPEQPTLYLHGTDDGCVGVEVAESARPLVGPHVAIEIVPGAGHFLHLERPDTVNDRILEHLT